MPIQSGQVFKLWLYRDGQEARHENSRDKKMFLEESELRILSRVSNLDSETGLKQVYTVYLYNLEPGDFKCSAMSNLNIINFPLDTLLQSFPIFRLSLATARFWLP